MVIISFFNPQNYKLRNKKTLGKPHESGAEGKSLNLGKEFLLNLRLIFAESDIFSDHADV